ncbi:MAG: tRNA uridine-5-carboxymethylaminomethyl(34) synthesis GTPase MnmE [Bacteroidota bacterium]
MFSRASAYDFSDTIAAPATASGIGAIAIVRLSGPMAINICASVFRGANLREVLSHTVHFGTIRDESGILDEVVVTVFKAPASFTKEDVVEISCHGSPYIVKRLLELLIEKGARMARPGEFTQRAFLNGRFDLSRAEAVADLIAADSAAAHHAALNQMRGGISREIIRLRSELLRFAALLELELDFSEEDVEFADRAQLVQLIKDLRQTIAGLKGSFAAGNVMKNGVPVVIAGKPNAGKSTLLNRLLQEEKAIVSPVAGTTRDYIEDTAVLEGYTFRFTDTAGLRETNDTVEALGVQRTHERISKASVIIYLFDLSEESPAEVAASVAALAPGLKPVLCIGNKSDLADSAILPSYSSLPGFIAISARDGANTESLKNALVAAAALPNLQSGDTVISNLRHFESLKETDSALESALGSLQAGRSGDLTAADIRRALYYLGTISGEVGTEELLGEIFGKFCIGK